ncbi:MAG TPA: bifunctional pyr operon transcriptional regulator/uracil phosphoribosyltransferase PyrR [Burkholderiales bacterium]|nr:bifunctional pyr operon transcriptional regulator/uracil phosphoribosyltransferase PyrR [Burkholderiales bacterium]
MSTRELPDAEALLAELARQMRPAVSANTALVGIRTGGAWIAERLHRELAIAVPLGTLDVSFYRDDYEQRGLHANVKPSEIPFKVEGRDIILVDDVLYTGRTIRAAMNEMFDYGRPASIRLAALVDRGNRELPIAAQFVAATAALAPGESIELIRDDNGRLGLTLHRD